MSTTNWRSNLIWAPIFVGGLVAALFLSARGMISLPIAIALPLALGATLARW